jgi:hypothetical protein
MSRGFISIGRSGPRLGVIVPVSGRFFMVAAAVAVIPFGYLVDACNWIDDSSRSKLFGLAFLVIIAGVYLLHRKPTPKTYWPEKIENFKRAFWPY